MSRWACGCLVDVFPVTAESERLVCPSCCYKSIPPRTVATLKFRKVEESKMNTVRTIEITIPDNYTADEVRAHLAKLPVKRPDPGTVAYYSWCSSIGKWEDETRYTKERWINVEQACREGYVEKDKIEAALANRETLPVTTYANGYRDAWDKLSQLIREAMK